MLTLDFGSNWHKTIGVDNNDQLIEKADSYWVDGMLLKKRNKNYKKAKTIYLKVLKRSPKDYRALSMYASMLIEQKRYDDADTIYHIRANVQDRQKYGKCRIRILLQYRRLRRKGWILE